MKDTAAAGEGKRDGETTVCVREDDLGGGERGGRGAQAGLIPAVTIEDHGLHPPIDTDVVIAEQICRRTAALIPDEVAVLPPITVGFSPHHLDGPDVLTARWDTFIRYVAGIIVCVPGASMQARAIQGLSPTPRCRRTPRRCGPHDKAVLRRTGGRHVVAGREEDVASRSG